MTIHCNTGRLATNRYVYHRYEFVAQTMTVEQAQNYCYYQRNRRQLVSIINKVEDLAFSAYMETVDGETIRHLASSQHIN